MRERRKYITEMTRMKSNNASEFQEMTMTLPWRA